MATAKVAYGLTGARWLVAAAVPGAVITLLAAVVGYDWRGPHYRCSRSLWPPWRV